MIEKIRGVYEVQPVDKVRQQKAEAKGRKDDADGVEVSPFAKELAAASAEMKKIPDVRQEKVEQIKKEIEGGTYSPDLREVARRLFLAGILREDKES